MAVTRRPARLRASQRGTTMVEFTLVATVFFAVMFGIFEMASLWGDKVALEHAASDAARRAAQLSAKDILTNKTTLNAAAAQPILEAQVRDQICQSYGNKLDCSKLGVILTSYDNPDPKLANGITWQPFDYVQVELSYPWAFPVLHDLLGSSLAGGGTFHAKSRTIIE